ncbi:MAG: transposase, partial [Actinobacteria bacterium]|nr:transposase [Actinomycetota bacterium]
MPDPWPSGRGRETTNHGSTTEVLRRATASAIDEVIVRGRMIPDVARDLGIGSAETLRNWVKQGMRDRGIEAGPTTDQLAELAVLRREVADLRRRNEILKAATTFPCGKPTVPH